MNLSVKGILFFIDAFHYNPYNKCLNNVFYLKMEDNFLMVYYDVKSCCCCCCRVLGRLFLGEPRPMDGMHGILARAYVSFGENHGKH